MSNQPDPETAQSPQNPPLQPSPPPETSPQPAVVTASSEPQDEFSFVAKLPAADRDYHLDRLLDAAKILQSRVEAAKRAGIEAEEVVSDQPNLTQQERLLLDAQAALGDNDLLLSFDVQMLSPSGEVFRVKSMNALSQITSDDMLPEAMRNFEALVWAAFYRPLKSAFQQHLNQCTGRDLPPPLFTQPDDNRSRIPELPQTSELLSTSR
jgi:hypothetical protein